MICIRCSEHEGNTGNGLCQRCTRDVARGEKPVSGTPRTDAACDYTAPEKLHRLCKEMELEQAKMRRDYSHLFAVVSAAHEALGTPDDGDFHDLVTPIKELLERVAAGRHQ